MRRIILLMGVILISLLSYAQTVKYVECSPKVGSSIDEFKFTLTFDITEAVAHLGTGEWGLGYAGSSTTNRYTALFKGDQNTGEELARALQSNFTGKSDGWSIGNNKVNISFPDSFVPEENQIYTLVIRNNFSLYASGKAVPNSSVTLKCEDNPIILTFIGKKAGENKLLVQNISIEDNSSLDELKEVKYTFNTAITAISGAKVIVKENDNVICESLSTTVENGNTLVADFGDKVNLNLGHAYNVILPAGVVSIASDNSKTNNEFSFNVNGTKTYTYGVSSISPSQGEISLPLQVRIKYEVPEGTSITGGKNQWIDTSLKIYKSEISEENLISSLYGSSSTDGITWDVSSLSFEPSTKYIMYREEGLNNLYYKDNFEKLPEWNNEETNSYFVTPSIENAGIPQLVFRNPVNGKYEGTGTELLPNSKVEYLGTLQLGLKDYKYSYEGNSYDPSYMNNATVYLYDITNGAETLVAERSITTRTIEPEDWHIPTYTVWNAGINTYLLSGHKYKVVIPAGMITVNYKPIRYFVSPEWSIELEGDAPTEVVLENCSLPENSELSELSSVQWTFKGGFTLDAGKSVMLKYTYKSSSGQEEGMSFICPTTIANYGSQTIVVAYLPASENGMGYQFNPKYNNYEIIFPEGLIYYEGDPNIKNSEMVYTIIPVAKAETQYVNLSLNVYGAVSSTNKVEKDKPFTFTLEPADNWKVESVMHGDKVLSAKNGVYTTEPLNESAEIRANLEYAGTWADYSETTGVWTVKDTNIRIYSDNQQIVVEGVTPDNEINVYSVSGLHINSTRVAENHDCVRITVATGQVYIVTVDGKAAKIQL